MDGLKTWKLSTNGIFQPTDDEIKSIWSVGLLTVDANAVLDLYRYHISTILIVRKACPDFYINWWRSGNPNSSKNKQGIRLRCFIAWNTTRLLQPKLHNRRTQKEFQFVINLRLWLLYQPEQRKPKADVGRGWRGCRRQGSRRQAPMEGFTALLAGHAPLPKYNENSQTENCWYCKILRCFLHWHMH